MQLVYILGADIETLKINFDAWADGKDFADVINAGTIMTGQGSFLMTLIYNAPPIT